ncbi:MAG: hypothetical protein WC471_05500 [Candidatus Woesearchaeota archaeon]
MVNLSQALLHYKRPEIQREIALHAREKEVCGSFNNEGFSKRPDIVEYPKDVLEMVMRGITSFHCSEELWNEPMQLMPSLPKNRLDELRKGWDLILDIDCKELEFSKIAAHYLIEALKYHGIKSVYCKFSGNHGFHIGVPFEALPEKVLELEVKNLFPEAPRRIAAYLKSMIDPHLRKALMEKYTNEQIGEMIKKPVSDFVIDGLLQPFEFLEIDTVLISSRHMYRMPYSFNEKSGWVSIPIRPEDVLTFNKESAKPEKVIVSGIKFLERDITPNQANRLFVQAYDFNPEIKEAEEEKRIERKFEDLQQAVPEQYFPPCIQKIFGGLEDGKKRAIFVLINFLSNVGWSKDQIEQRLYDWNKVNPEPLREVYIKGQLASLRYKKNKVLPPNCISNAYYKDLGLCNPDNLCARVKNPVNYSRRKILAQKKAEEKPKAERSKLSEEQKAMRRAYREKIKQEKSPSTGTAIADKPPEETPKELLE